VLEVEPHLEVDLVEAVVVVSELRLLLVDSKNIKTVYI
jgi:hypothetical protein